MGHHPLPANRLYLSHTLAEPELVDGEAVFYVRTIDARRSIVRQSLTTGPAGTLTAEPPPAGTVGYGGGFFAVGREVLVYAAKDCRLWAIRLSTGEQWPVTPTFEGVASPAISPDGRWLAFVAEQAGRANVRLTALDGKSLPVQLSDDPWYANSPSFSPDGSRIAWQEWGEFDMPWDRSWLRLARFARSANAASAAHELLPLEVATVERDGASLASPLFSPDGRWLAYTGDETGWRSLWVSDADGADAVRIETGEGEIGLPDWNQRRLSIRWSPAGDALYAVRRHDSRDSLLRIAWPERTLRELPNASTTLTDRNSGLGVPAGDRLPFIGSTPTSPHALFVYDVRAERETAIATTSVGLVDPASLSIPERASWPTANGERAYGIFYPAVGPLVGAEPRPLLVFVHGGPTSETSDEWNPQAQYFATRGWHYLCVNHRGGTGRGRAYQNRLVGQWGVVDVEDARSGAQALIERGVADPRRVAITGGSAGGYTTLLALATQPDFWTAGVALYPVGDLYELKQGSHRFEVNYEETLIGRLPEAGPLWKARSPLTHAARVRAPLLIFHGRDDKAVPHQQSVDFAEAVRRNGGTAELVSYDGEGHGFLKEATRRDVIERMERFLDKHVICLQ